MPFTIATWNINSVRLRMPIVERLLKEHAPDVLCLQETKVPDELFPEKAFRKAGYEHILKLINDQESEFLVKHAGLKALRFFWEYRPDVLTRKQILDGMAALMANPDIADMPMDDLRKWQAWEMIDAVLSYASKESHNSLPINRRAILKFALAASWANPKNPQAAEFVAKARKDDPERVKLLEELLRDDMKPAPKLPEPPKK